MYRDTYIHGFIDICTNTNMYIRIHVHTNTNMHTCIHIYIERERVCVCVHVYTICLHISTHIFISYPHIMVMTERSEEVESSLGVRESQDFLLLCKALNTSNQIAANKLCVYSLNRPCYPSDCQSEGEGSEDNMLTRKCCSLQSTAGHALESP